MAAHPAISVVTVSQESLASLAAHFSLPLLSTFRRLITLFVSLGATHVLDAAFGNDLALLQTRQQIESALL